MIIHGIREGGSLFLFLVKEPVSSTKIRYNRKAPKDKGTRRRKKKKTKEGEGMMGVKKCAEKREL